MNGYDKDSDANIPSYREVTTIVKAYNPYRGWIPVFFNDDYTESVLTKVKMSQPLSEIEFLIKNGSDSPHLTIPFNSSAQQLLRTQFDVDFEYTRFVGKSQAQQMIDHVRNIILNWALELEDDGILGEDMVFSEEEKDVAMAKKYNIHNYYYGNITDSQIQQCSDESSQSIK